jgi:hypothetical protein
MQSIDEARLETDSQYRYEYLAGFMGFGPEDAALIQAIAPFLGPLIPQLVEKTYEKLLSYDATARHFVPRQAGYEGPLPEGVANLTLSHPQVRFRKEHLSRYFMQLLGRSYDAKMVQYLDMVGKMHTPKAGSKEIDVPLVQMNALLGLLADTLTEAISQQPLDTATMLHTLRAFHKLLWIQNDFVTRHYCNGNASVA